ncbi:hypothetical protein [Streptosporangium roseum]|uniref:hypothetical protein n=1 Tax=Streptosporangium roseum TaxID=2001 RepID=UPI0033313999
MPPDELADAIYFRIEQTIADNYRGTEGGYLVSPSAVAALATSAAVAVIAEQDKNLRQQFEDLLASIWLYIGWRSVTKRLTTKQKDLFADAVEASSHRRDDDPPDKPVTVDRWWRG